jgi:hypothetical protein
MIVRIGGTPIPDSDFADPENRLYPIIDKTHVMSAMQHIMWQYYNLDREYIEGLPRDMYLRKIHDRIIERANILHMDIKRLHRNCPWCCKEKVQFT